MFVKFWVAGGKGGFTQAMMTKKASPVSTHQLFWLVWKLVMAFTFGLCALSFLRQQESQSELSSLVYRRTRLLDESFAGRAKVAFLFIARRNLPLDFLWGSFFENADAASFSIYIHSEPGFVFDERSTRSAFFYNRQLTSSIKVRWGESSMIEAERLLIKAALEDPTNRRFVLLSDSFLDKREVRYNPKMSHIIPVNKWRKGSQWIALIRHHAEVVKDDKVIFPVFNKFCKRRPPIDASKGKKNIKLQKLHNCIPDEHYVQTLLAMSHLENELERRTVTYTLWNQSTTNMETTGWHPVKFSYANAGPQQIKRIKDINNVYYETEYRTEWCSNNSTSVPCFLFARKFSQGAAMRLLSEGVVGTFDAFV